MTLFYFEQSNIFFKCAIIFYFFSIVFYLVFAFTRKYKNFPILLLGTGWLFNTALILNYWVMYETIPVFTTHQILIFFTWSLVFLYIILEFSIKFKLLGLVISFTSFFYAMRALDYKTYPPFWFENLIYLLEIFALSLIFLIFLFSFLYLIFPETKELSGHWLDLKNLDFNKYLNRAINYSLIFIFITIITRSFWSFIKKGSIWISTWQSDAIFLFMLLNLAILHLKQSPKWREKRVAWLLVSGILIIIVFLSAGNFLI